MVFNFDVRAIWCLCIKGLTVTLLHHIYRYWKSISNSRPMWQSYGCLLLLGHRVKCGQTANISTHETKPCTQIHCRICGFVNAADSGSKFRRPGHLCGCWCCYRRVTSCASLIRRRWLADTLRARWIVKITDNGRSLARRFDSQTLHSMSSNYVWFMSAF